VQWVRRYIYLHGERNAAEMGKAEGGFSHSARGGARRDGVHAVAGFIGVALPVQGVQHLGLPWLAEVTRAKRPARLPTVLTRAEAQGLLDCGFQDDSYPGANRSGPLGHPCR